MENSQISEQLHFLNISENDFNVNMRNLAKDESLNVKELLYEHEQSIKTKKKTKKKLSKSEQIIQKNKLKKDDNLRKEDIKKFKHYSEIKDITPDIISDLKYFKTEYGKNRMKYKFLEIAYKNKDKSTLIELYLQLINVDTIDKREEKYRKKVTKYMKEINYKQLQFEELSNRLPPLDFYNNYKIELEDWQIKTLNHIKHGKNVLVCVKTSMGKTWLATYPALINKKTLFIVPTKPLAKQVCAIITKFLGDKVSIVIEDYERIVNNSTVLVGTPKEIENIIYKLDFKFEVVVCDEIHNLNYYDGDSYERLIKLYAPKCQLIALSATIKKANDLKIWFENISNKPCNLIEHSIRFLNLQRHVWNKNILEKIHPLACLDVEDITEEFLNNNLPLTPFDSIQLFKSLKNNLPDKIVDKLDINNVFPENNKRLTLEDSRYYENLLKRFLLDLKNKQPDILTKILHKFHKKIEPIQEKIDLYKLFKSIKNKKLTPCIVFQLTSNNCKEIFKKIVKYLERLEVLNYPFYYDNLDYTYNQFMNFTKKKNTFSKNIKFGKDVIDPQQEKEKMEKSFEEKEFESYIKNLIIRKDKQTRMIEDSHKNDSISEKIMKIQIINLHNEYEEYLNKTSFIYVDKFKKHPDFCFNTLAPMSEDQIREIRIDLCHKLGVKVDYNNDFIQGLKRGIGIYAEDLPDVYNQTVQTLAQDKELGFVISDKTLALGINMPFRTTTILGYKDHTEFDINDYQQMIGRSGRRGKDSEGHLVYANVDWKILMKGALGDIVGKQRILYNYKILNQLSNNFSINMINNTFKNYVNKNIDFKDNKITDKFAVKKCDNQIIWHLRYFNDRVYFWINQQKYMNIYFNKSTIKIDDLACLLSYILKIFYEEDFNSITNITKNTDFQLIEEHQKIIKSFKFNKITDSTLTNKFIAVSRIIMCIHNQLIEDKIDNRYISKNLVLVLQKTFDDLIKLINNYYSFNSN
uniref:Helicase ATP-binding domain-containing protein n=1 Tax=viral metagenome TaxID=1070528 RepID=A0A6C0LXL7_9ZZZZ